MHLCVKPGLVVITNTLLLSLPSVVAGRLWISADRGQMGRCLTNFSVKTKKERERGGEKKKKKLTKLAHSFC